MGIDGITLIAQIVNLFVLIWLLKRFLYRPILNVVDQREAAIQKQLGIADAARAAWEEKTAMLDAQKKQFEEQKEALLTATVKEVKTYQRSAQKEIDLFRADKEAQIRQETLAQKEVWERAIRQSASDSVIVMLKKIATDFGIETTPEKSFALFEKSLQKLSTPEKKKLHGAIEQTGSVTLESAVPLSKTQQAQIREQLHRHLKAPVAVAYKTVPDLGFGFCLKSGAFKADWNIETYFNTVSDQFNQTVQHNIHPEGSAQ